MRGYLFRALSGGLLLVALLATANAEPVPAAPREKVRRSRAVAAITAQCDRQTKQRVDAGAPPSAAKGLKVVADGGTAAERSELATAIATAAGQKVERVLWDSVVGKYIGETEKNLKALLTRAEANDVVLFFDEAEALFGKRTDPSDPDDRPRPRDLDLIFERLAAHDGIVVFGAKLTEKDRPNVAQRVHRVVKASARRAELWSSLCP